MHSVALVPLSLYRKTPILTVGNRCSCLAFGIIIMIYSYYVALYILKKKIQISYISNEVAEWRV